MQKAHLNQSLKRRALNMKNYNEIADTIFERRDEYLAQQKAKRKKIVQALS